MLAALRVVFDRKASRKSRFDFSGLFGHCGDRESRLARGSRLVRNEIPEDAVEPMAYVSTRPSRRFSHISRQLRSIWRRAQDEVAVTHALHDSADEKAPRVRFFLHGRFAQANKRAILTDAQAMYACLFYSGFRRRCDIFRGRTHRGGVERHARAVGASNCPNGSANSDGDGDGPWRRNRGARRRQSPRAGR